MYKPEITYKDLKGRKNMVIYYNKVAPFQKLEWLEKEAELRNIELHYVGDQILPSCYAELYNEDGQLRYGAMVCGACAYMEECYRVSTERLRNKRT